MQKPSADPNIALLEHLRVGPSCFSDFLLGIPAHATLLCQGLPIAFTPLYMQRLIWSITFGVWRLVAGLGVLPVVAHLYLQ